MVVISAGSKVLTASAFSTCEIYLMLFSEVRQSLALALSNRESCSDVCHFQGKLSQLECDLPHSCPVALVMVETHHLLQEKTSIVLGLGVCGKQIPTAN